MFCGHIPSVAAQQVFIIVYVKCDVQFVKAGFKEQHICLLFASLTQRLSEMWGKKCDFTVTINKPISSSPTGKGCGLHTKREGKVLSYFQTMLVKKMAVLPHLLCLLDVACVVVA
jgi:hypothetical protein